MRLASEEKLISASATSPGLCGLYRKCGRVHQSNMDNPEAQLTGQERTDLYAVTEASFEQAIDDLTLLQDRVNGLSPPSGVEEANKGLQLAAVTLTESASGVLEGMQLPARAEQTPGTARRQAIVEFDNAATSFFEAADLAVQQST